MLSSLAHFVETNFPRGRLQPRQQELLTPRQINKSRTARLQSLGRVCNHLCEAKGEQDGEANKAQECFAEFVIPSSDSPVAFDFLEEVFYPMTTAIELCGEWVRPQFGSCAQECRF